MPRCLPSLSRALLVGATLSALLVGAAGCDDSIPYEPRPDAGGLGGDRPTTVTVPASYDPKTPAPLVVILHGYFSLPGYITPILGLDGLADSEGALVVAPHGNLDPSGNYYWNATDACCDAYDKKPDDAGYLLKLIDDIRKAYNVDGRRIFLIGHSNGAFMAQRLACQRADLFAGVISIAGAIAARPEDCQPTQPVSLVQVHGDADEVILYTGGQLRKNDGRTSTYPSAAETVKAWARLDHCADTTAAETALDFENTAGAETTRVKYAGCPAGIDVELWTVGQGSHIPGYGAGAATAFKAWMKAHSKP